MKKNKNIIGANETKLALFLCSKVTIGAKCIKSASNGVPKLKNKQIIIVSLVMTSRLDTGKEQ